MEKVIHPYEEIKKNFWGRIKIPAGLNREVMQSLDGIASKVIGDNREVFLSQYYGYVWCFMHRYVFGNSLLLRIQEGQWSPLSFLADYPDSQKIISDLRTAYNTNPVKFLHLEYKNPFYDPRVIGDAVFSRNPMKNIGIYLAVEGGDKMAYQLESILNKHNVVI